LTRFSVTAPIVFSAVIVLCPFPRGSDADTIRDRENRRPRPVRSLLEIRQDSVVIQHWDLSCGAAALATILTYQHGDPVSERTIAEGMLRRTDPLRVKVRGGFSLLDLKRFAEARGYTADGFSNVTVDDLVKLAPSIVPVKLSGYDHFVIFRGVVGDKVLLADPGFGNRTVPLERFQETWVNNVAFVVGRTHPGTYPNKLLPRPDDFVTPAGITLRTAIRSGYSP
jgi:uncharacterized protein